MLNLQIRIDSRAPASAVSINRLFTDMPSLYQPLLEDGFVPYLIQSEWDNRRNRAVERAVKAAQFRYNASLENMDYTYERGLDRNRRTKHGQSHACMSYAVQGGRKRS